MPEKYRCVCCGTESKWGRTVRLPAFMFGVSAEVLRCPRCGLGRTFPPPSALQEQTYENNTRYKEIFTARAALYRGFARSLLTSVDGLIEPAGKRLLDVGCGGGFMLEVAGQMDFLAEGIEGNPELFEWCLDRGLKVKKGDVTELNAYVKGPYDIIILSSIVEHVPEPRVLLSKSKSLLKPKGVIVLQQAAYDGLLPRVFPWGWYGWQPKDHYWHFTSGSLDLLCKNLGFKIVRAIRRSLYHPWILKGGSKEIAGRNLAALIARIGDKFGRGDCLNIVLSKNP